MPWSALIHLFYGWPLAVSLTNALLMLRPKGKGAVCFEVLIPARNEAENLPHLIPVLVESGCRVTVFDDDSDDGTGEVARRLGAEVLTPAESLPEGWTGKNRACHSLAAQAEEEWVVFLDADTRPSPQFAAALSSHLASIPPGDRVVSGCLRILPGKGLEPGYLFWVAWIILATNPFGLVSRSGRGHNMFLNGQFSAWRRDTLLRVKPYELVHDQVLDDVMIGRALARLKIPVDVLDMSHVLAVQMYRDTASAVKGMSKNSADIVPGRFGWLVLAVVLAAYALAWAGDGTGAALAALAVSAIGVNVIARVPWWALPLLPFSLLAASATVCRSAWLRRRGLLEWKGRKYGGAKDTR